MMLLVAMGTDLLSTQEGVDYFWRLRHDDDDAFFHKDGVRILRNIGCPDKSRKNINESTGLDATDVMEDIIHVLTMTQPQSISVQPSPDQLERTARRPLA